MASNGRKGKGSGIAGEANVMKIGQIRVNFIFIFERLHPLPGALIILLPSPLTVPLKGDSYRSSDGSSGCTLQVLWCIYDRIYDQSSDRSSEGGF